MGNKSGKQKKKQSSEMIFPTKVAYMESPNFEKEDVEYMEAERYIPVSKNSGFETEAVEYVKKKSPSKKSKGKV